MKRRTPNTERRIVHWIGKDRVKEVAPVYGAMRQTDSTPNAQHPTSNAQGNTNPRFNLEDRLLDFSARIIRLVDALPNTRAANHLAGQILRSGISPYGNHGEVGSFALLLSILHAFAAQVFAGFGPATHFPTMTP